MGGKMLRSIYSNGGVLEDFSRAVYNYHAKEQVFSVFATTDYLYFLSELPFNHLYFKFGSAHTNASEISISYWTGNKDWQEVVDIIDETDLNGASFGQDGYVTWTTDKDYQWDRSDTNRNRDAIEGLEDIKIYDRYAVRIGFSDQMSTNVSLSWVGHLFSNDDDLSSEYPDLVRSNMISSIESGKTNYEEQHVRAAQIIIADLKKMKTIKHQSQILDRDDLTLASVSKTAEIIFNTLGDDYTDNKNVAREEYKQRLNSAIPRVDLDKNARINDDEIGIRPGRLIR
jgi:hypothetical protein